MDAKYSILYLEDNPVDVDLLINHFQEFAQEFSIEIAGTGAECLRMVGQNKYDLILLDNKLPDIDGIDILKELVLVLPSVPMIMITGSGDEDLVISALRIGAASYISKAGNYITILPALMQQIIEEFKSKKFNSIRLGANSRRVLYVEKSKIDIDLTIEHLRNYAKPITVQGVETATKAFDLLQSGSEFDLILIDLRMDDMNALEFLKMMKVKKIKLPVIVVTGKGDELHAVASIHLGAYDYIVKRNDYLVQLPYAIYNAIDKFILNQQNQKLINDLFEINKQLENKNDELERFNKVFINREFRIKELRDKIEELEKK
ncbi:MAG: response regulator [Bacteroidetes bacterium]|nr:response regulator [Bacteroidota bacterium]MBL6944378.1 response regulator [Bacteroidales bacterium]